MNNFIRIFIAFFIFYTPFFSYAAKVDWEIRKLSYQRSLEIAEPVVNIEAVRKLVNGANQTAKVQVPVNSSTLGSSAKMLIKGGLASAAIYGIVEGVGWVIENGAVVKKKDLQDPTQIPNVAYYYKFGQGTFANAYFLTEKAAFNYVLNLGNSTYVSPYYLKTDISNFNYLCPNPYFSYSSSCSFGARSIIWTTGSWSTDKSLGYTTVQNPNYNPSNPPPSVQTEPVTDDELGQAIIDSPSASTVIPDVYNPNQTTDTPAKDASATALDKAIPDSDTDVSTKPNPNKDTDGDGVPDTYDPELPDEGTTTQIPAFCDWASTMCLWYERYLDDSKKLEEHQTEEKTFWEDVKDWFDWTKEPVDEEPDTEQQEPDTQGIFDRTFDTDFSLSSNCPPDIPFSLETHFFSGSWNISMKWLCIIFTFLGYPLVFLSHCVGLWILYEAVVQREIKW